MVEVRFTGDDLIERIQRAVDKVKDRLQRATGALNDAGIACSDEADELS